jgi:hypothetical protein
MPNPLVVEERRMRTALTSQHYGEALLICERLGRALRVYVDGLRTAGDLRKSIPTNGTRLGEWAPASQIAHEQSIDVRTLWSYVKDEDFVAHPSDRMRLVHRPRFQRWLEERGGRVRINKRRK